MAGEIMTEPMTSERLAEIDEIRRCLLESKTVSYTLRTDAAELLRALRAEVVRLRAQVAVRENILAALASGKEVQSKSTLPPVDLRLTATADGAPLVNPDTYTPGGGVQP